MVHAGWEPPTSFDEYRIVRLLGHGAMGRVYLAHDALLDRSVAIKFLGALEVGNGVRERFFTEARAVARLSHPNVVAVHRAGEVRRRPYLVSEYVSGTSLDLIAKPLAWERIVKIGIGLARGLASAHRAGVLHRDIKPANVVISEDDEAKLLDFGLAKLLDAAAPAAEPLGAVPSMPSTETELAATLSVAGSPRQPPSRGWTALDAEVPASRGSPLTAVGAIVGTPLYLAPEMWLGEPASRRTDIYALGVVLYELACGRAPNAGAPPGELGLRARERDSAPVASCSPGLPAALASLIDSCVCRDPEKRPPSGDVICERLEAMAQVPWRHAASEDIAEPPFRRLASFTEADRGQLHGRDRELVMLAEQVLFRRMVVFTAPSGTGKSSLLRAGLQPRLAEKGVHVIYASSRTEPAAAIIADLAPGAATVAEAVSAWSATHSARLVIILDQVETLLGDRPPGTAGQVLDDVIAFARDEASPRVSTVISVREDFLARVLAYTQRPDDAGLPIVRLGPLALQGARDAIVRPLVERGLGIEPELLERLLGDSRDCRCGAGIGAWLGRRGGGLPAAPPAGLLGAVRVARQGRVDPDHRPLSPPGRARGHRRRAPRPRA